MGFRADIMAEGKAVVGEAHGMLDELELIAGTAADPKGTWTAFAAKRGLTVRSAQTLKAVSKRKIRHRLYHMLGIEEYSKLFGPPDARWAGPAAKAMRRRR